MPRFLLFYRDVLAYREIRPRDSARMRAEFDRIRMRYIGDEAVMHVGVSEEVVDRLRWSAAHPGAGSFDEAFQENAKVLMQDVFRAFRAWPPARDWARARRANKAFDDED
jgi:hypothetical protein